MALKDRLYPCPAASPSCLTAVQGEVKQAQSAPATRQCAGAKAVTLPQSGQPPQGVMGKKEKEGRGEGQREGTGNRGWGTPHRGSSGGTKFAE